MLVRSPSTGLAASNHRKRHRHRRNRLPAVVKAGGGKDAGVLPSSPLSSDNSRIPLSSSAVDRCTR